jgi:hypothetical protein
MRNNLLFLLCFFSPIAIVIVRKSVLYDGWRHLYFIYPCFLLLALNGMTKLIATLKKKRLLYLGILGGLYLLSMTATLFFMVQNHPHQNVYFNFLLPREDEYLRRNWELDYWGVSYRQALEHILAIDPTNKIKVVADTNPADKNTLILAKAERERIEFVEDLRAGHYFITNYRWHPRDYKIDSEIYSIVVQGSKIMSVFKVVE